NEGSKLNQLFAVVRPDLENVHGYYLPDALRFNNAQPVGSTAAASAILIASPGRNGKTAILKAAIGGVFVSTANHAQPPRKITAEPIAIAAYAVRYFLSQPCSANAPVTYAAAGNATRYPPVGPKKRTMPAPPFAKNGKPTAPSIKYAITAAAPKRDPSNAPVNSTAKLCPVIGTGPIGIVNCAKAAMNKLKTITSPAERVQSSGASTASINVSALS